MGKHRHNCIVTSVRFEMLTIAVEGVPGTIKHKFIEHLSKYKDYLIVEKPDEITEVSIFK